MNLKVPETRHVTVTIQLLRPEVRAAGVWTLACTLLLSAMSRPDNVTQSVADYLPSSESTPESPEKDARDTEVSITRSSSAAQSSRRLPVRPVDRTGQRLTLQENRSHFSAQLPAPVCERDRLNAVAPLRC